MLALLVRIELLTPKQTIMTAEQYNQVFTLHGAIMVFLFIIPSIPAALGNFVLPLMLGAKDVAFPRLNLVSLYIYWTGALMALARDRLRRRRHRLDVLHAVLDDDRRRGQSDGAGGVRARASRRSSRAELHRHHPQAARARHELVPHAAVRVGDVRDRASSRSWRRRCSASRCCC